MAIQILLPEVFSPEVVELIKRRCVVRQEEQRLLQVHHYAGYAIAIIQAAHLSDYYWKAFFAHSGNMAMALNVDLPSRHFQSAESALTNAITTMEGFAQEVSPQKLTAVGIRGKDNKGQIAYIRNSQRLEFERNWDVAWFLPKTPRESMVGLATQMRRTAEIYGIEIRDFVFPEVEEPRPMPGDIVKTSRADCLAPGRTEATGYINGALAGSDDPIQICFNCLQVPVRGGLYSVARSGGPHIEVQSSALQPDGVGLGHFIRHRPHLNPGEMESYSLEVQQWSLD
ncbi:MAG TPA: hypothetical protein V6D07_18595 [Trichocoleus sp.]